MPRFAFVLAAVSSLGALAPAHALADAPPPDRFGPCEGLSPGAQCFEAGCACVTVTDGCPNAAASCLSCQRGTAWCGPVNYHPSDPGGCSSLAPGSAAALGGLLLVLLARRRAR